MYKVISYKLITKGRKVIGVDPESRRVEYLPDNGEGEKALEWFIEHLYKGLEEYLTKTM
ncbi:MAG: hypothetical protein K6U74_13010 [Firmicutes bacterium]|nr:hypothetical protein [Bacillota bacterium]